MAKTSVKKAINKSKQRAEGDARKAMLQDLFYDLNKSKVEVFWMNFFRGIFFGVGSVLGATVVIAILVSILSLLADVPGVFGDFIRYIVDVVNSGRR